MKHGRFTWFFLGATLVNLLYRESTNFYLMVIALILIRICYIIEKQYERDN